MKVMAKFLLALVMAAFMASPALSAGKQDIGDMLPRENAIINAPGSKKIIYTGNVKTKKFHAPDCKFYDCRDCSASFKSQAEALAAGYERCKKCPGWPEE